MAIASWVDLNLSVQSGCTIDQQPQPCRIIQGQRGSNKLSSWLYALDRSSLVGMRLRYDPMSISIVQLCGALHERRRREDIPEVL